MANIKLLGDAVVITSAIELKKLNLVKKYEPKALVLMEEKNEIFRVTTGANASISKSGVCFNSADNEGMASMTLTLPANMATEAKIEYVKEQYGYGLLALNSMEATIFNAADKVAGEFEAMESTIQVL